jgi:hypothetical protein
MDNSEMTIVEDTTEENEDSFNKVIVSQTQRPSSGTTIGCDFIFSRGIVKEGASHLLNQCKHVCHKIIHMNLILRSFPSFFRCNLFGCHKVHPILQSKHSKPMSNNGNENKLTQAKEFLEKCSQGGEEEHEHEVGDTCGE